MTQIDNTWETFIADNRLPEGFRHTIIDYYMPLASWLARTVQTRSHSVIGINGSQGSGKSTLADFLGRVLSAEYGLRVVVLSIDDLYLTRNEREVLRRDIHPLLLTRGVPGTHDVELGRQILDALRSLQHCESLLVPRFDKLSDDRLPEEQWQAVAGPVDIVIFEGWCVGSVAQPEDALSEPVNQLEAELDVDGRWRKYVNDQLADEYADLFSRLDELIFLQAPDMECVRRWRFEQEQKLMMAGVPAGGRTMSAQEIQRFTQHFERITLENIVTLPRASNVTIRLDREHCVQGVKYLSGT